MLVAGTHDGWWGKVRKRKIEREKKRDYSVARTVSHSRCNDKSQRGVYLCDVCMGPLNSRNCRISIIITPRNNTSYADCADYSQRDCSGISVRYVCPRCLKYVRY